MGREIITIQVGQAGTQIGNALWELYCMEHGITATGQLKNENMANDSNRIETLFYESKDGRFIPRSIFIDLEPSVIDEIRTGSYKELFNPACLVNGMEDAASNYARGFFNIGKRHIETFMDIVRKMVNHCDYVALFEVINSYPGGTGSGLTALLLERLSEDFAKTFRFETGIFPSVTLSESTVGPYNSLLFTHATFESLDCGILVDNESIYKKLCIQLECLKPTFSMINRFLSQMLSCIFLSHRYSYQGSQHMDVDELMTNSVPYPRIHFPVLAYAPIVNANQINHEVTKPFELIRQIFQSNSHFLNCPMQETKYISCCLLFRGLISPKEVYEAVAMIKGDYRIQFVDWCPTGFKIGINSQPSLSTPQHALAASSQTVCTLSGNVGIKEAWHNLRNKYHALVSKKAFIHWFIGEGLEESDFHEADEDIQVLENDYEEISKDTEPSNDVEVETLQLKKDSSIHRNTNTNNHLPNKESLSSQSKQINEARPSSRSSAQHNSYSSLLYEDIVSRLDTKLNSSNKRLVKKLNKLQTRLGRMNLIYLDNTNTEKYGDSLMRSHLRHGRNKTMFRENTDLSEEKELMKTNVVIIKRLIRRQTMSNLAFSSKEQIMCSPGSTSSNHNGNSSDTTLDTINGTEQRSLTTKVTSDVSTFI